MRVYRSVAVSEVVLSKNRAMRTEELCAWLTVRKASNGLTGLQLRLNLCQIFTMQCISHPSNAIYVTLNAT